MESPNISNTLSTFVDTKKHVLILLSVLIVLVVGGVVLWKVYSQRSNNKATELFESTNKQYKEFTTSYSMYKTEQDISDEKVEALVAKLNEIKDKYPKSVMAQMAIMRIGVIQLITKDYKNALQSFSVVVDKNTTAYFIPTAWFYIGSIQETLGNQDEAHKAFQRIVDNYSNSLVAPHAQYNLGRLAEKNGVDDIQNAVGYYQSLIANETWKKSSWANLAKSRLAMFGIGFDATKKDEPDANASNTSADTKDEHDTSNSTE